MWKVLIAVVIVLTIIIARGTIVGYHDDLLPGTWVADKAFCTGAGVKSAICIIGAGPKHDVVFALDSDELSYSVGEMRVKSNFYEPIRTFSRRASHETLSGSVILPESLTIQVDTVAGTMKFLDDAGTLYARMHKE